MEHDDMEIEELIPVILTRHEVEELLALAALWVRGVTDRDDIPAGTPLEAFLCPGLVGAMTELIEALGGYQYDGPASEFLA